MKELTAKYLRNPTVHHWILEQIEKHKTATDQDQSRLDSWRGLFNLVRPIYCQYAMYLMNEQTTHLAYKTPDFTFEQVVTVFDRVAEIQAISEKMHDLYDRLMQYSLDRPFKVSDFTAKNIPSELINELYNLFGEMLPLKYVHGFSKEFLNGYKENITQELIQCKQTNGKLLKGYLSVRYCKNGNIQIRFRKFTFVFDEFLGEFVF